MRYGEEVKIGLVKDNSAKTGKPGGVNMYQQHKKSRSRFIRLTQLEGRKNGASYMKDIDEFILDCGGPPGEHGGF